MRCCAAATPCSTSIRELTQPESPGIVASVHTVTLRDNQFHLAKDLMTNPAARADGIVVYWRPGCPYSIKLRTQLRLTRLKYTEVNIWDSPDAAAYVRSVAGGNETVPTVDVAGYPLVNPSLRQLLSAAREHAPGSLKR